MTAAANVIDITEYLLALGRCCAHQNALSSSSQMVAGTMWPGSRPLAHI